MTGLFDNSGGYNVQIESGNVTVTPPSVTPTRTDVAGSATVVTLLAANTARKPGSVVVNDSSAILYVKLGSAATTSDFYAAIDGKTNVPGILPIPDGYTGIITGIWASATGNARMTEMA